MLKSIGRGYARRFTFESDKESLNNNENYFWSDNRPEGYAFELEAISEGDKFTIFDVVTREAQGTVEIMKVEVSRISLPFFFLHFYFVRYRERISIANVVARILPAGKSQHG